MKHYGIGDRLSSPPTVTISAKGNGACLFNSLSLLLTGRDTYSAIIRHVVCNYIDNPIKLTFLRPYIPENFANGKQYMTSKNMCNFSTWETEVEIIAFAQISGFDVIVFTQQKSWARYKHDPFGNECREKSFYLTNEGGYHFDLIFNGLL